MVPYGDVDLPSRVWAVDDATGEVYEAKVTNPTQAEYHGYPLLAKDPFRSEIVREWQARAE